MRDERNQKVSSTPELSSDNLARKIATLVSRGRAVLFWEEFWPAILPLLGVASLFLIVSWFGIWLVVPPVWRMIGMAVFGLAALACLWPLLRLSIPGKDQALKRIEEVSGTRHRPLSSFDDQPAALAADSTSGQRLWKAHQARNIAALKTLRTGLPRPATERIDPFQLRALVVLLLVVAFAYAGSDKSRRIAALTDPTIEATPALARIDAWITPPDYTRRAPIFLTRAAELEITDAVSVPTGSVFSLQSDSADALDVQLVQAGVSQVLEPGSDEAVAEIGGADLALNQFQARLDADAEISVSGGFGETRSWQFTIIPDSIPEIAYNGQPQVARSGALELSYTLKDDYGIVSAEANVTLARDQPDDAVPLYDAPELPLSLPRSRVREGSGRTNKNLTEHPWAGIEVTLVLSARDEAEQEGVSSSFDMVLPIRPFREPMSRALVEQRQNLALDANQAGKVSVALDALLFAPEIFIDNVSVYLAMNTARRRLLVASDHDELRAVADLLWEIALAIEDGDLSDVERDLRAAQEALRDALENGASDEEIARLTEELRQAMNEYLQALARQMQQNPSAQQQMPFDQNSQLVTPQDLDQMLDQIEDLARSGSRDAAREMLSQMQQMLESLQNGQPQMSQQQQEMQQMMRDMGDLIERQQSLMDQTFQQQQQQQRQQQLEGQQGSSPDADRQRAMEELQQGQAELQQQLQELMDQMQQNGMQPGEQMGEADGAMGDAEQSLGEGQGGQALGSQSQALQALRDGAQDMMQQFAQQGQQGQPGQQGQQPGQPGGPPFGPGQQGQQMGRPGGTQNGLDPLGRPQQSRGTDEGNSVKVPGEIDIQRAREILDAIRKRLGDMERPDLELDYLERLLPQ